ncbi:MAG TPA: hypothetical protein VMV40_05685 [Acidiferrobacter sp.]|nr:hypothetical protein [Acidiferrobacter sp.]
MDRFEKQLLKVMRDFPDDVREQVLAFAEFLQGRLSIPALPTEPVMIPRPSEESVIKAIKRLAATYPMLDRGKMLNETSVLVAQNVLGGRPTADVIDDLEALFCAHFDAHRKSES